MNGNILEMAIMVRHKKARMSSGYSIRFSHYTQTGAKIWHCGNCGAMITTKRNRPKQYFDQPDMVIDGKSDIDDNHRCRFCVVVA